MFLCQNDGLFDSKFKETQETGKFTKPSAPIQRIFDDSLISESGIVDYRITYKVGWNPDKEGNLLSNILIWYIDPSLQEGVGLHEYKSGTIRLYLYKSVIQLAWSSSCLLISNISFFDNLNSTGFVQNGDNSYVKSDKNINATINIEKIIYPESVGVLLAFSGV